MIEIQTPRTFRRAASGALVVVACLFGAACQFDSSQLLAAEQRLATSHACWHTVETASFRILNYGPQPVSRETAEACEAGRQQITHFWLGDATPTTWNPKCDVVLHPTDAAYLREVGAGAGSTVASSLIDRKEGRVVARRIDIRATQSDWRSSALGHELTHVVLADRFAVRNLPRWVDEGTAIMADSTEKQVRHLKDLQQAVANRGQFRVVELISLGDYPDARRWGTFYGQSVSLVQFLVDQAGPERFVEFVELALEHGYEHSLRQVYQVGIADLEHRWQLQLKQTGASVAARKFDPLKTVQRTTVPHHEGIVAQPVSMETVVSTPANGR